jgi:anion-transporting  ArsA/GET3 family ATPase
VSAVRAASRAAHDADTLVGRLENLEVIICCGSGGVGKTTVSAALGLAIAQRSDRRVLVLTVDPARRLATALGLREIGTEPVKVSRARLRRAGIEVEGELVAAMLDMKSTFDRMVTRMAPTRRDAQRILTNRFYKGISDSFIGSHEYMAIEALYELHEAGEYDTLIIDTPPSRNALDFLEAPNRLTDFVGAKLLSWLSGPSLFGFRAVNVAAAPFLRMADRLLGADVLSEVTEFVGDLQKIYGGVQQRARAVYKLLRSPQVGFVVITTLEPAPFAEAEFFCSRLREYRMPLSAVVVNRTLPDSLRDRTALATASALADDDRLAAWLSQRLGHRVSTDSLHAIGERWLQFHAIAERDARQLSRLEQLGSVESVRIPLFSDDAGELDGLARIAALL